MTERLGTVSAPSGVLVVIDGGYLGMWSGDAEPVMPEGILSPEGREVANSAVDVRLVGPGAEEIGRALDRSWHPLYLHDLTQAQLPGLRQRVASLAAERGVEVALEVLPQRVPHRRRVDDAVAQGRGGGEVSFHGVWAAAIGDVPPGPHEVMADVVPAYDSFAGRLARVVVVVRDGAMIRSERVGRVGVDWARMLVGDADALGQWRHDDPLDGLADVVFWGRDAERLAALSGATTIGDDHGWLDLPIEEAAARYQQIVDLKAEHDLTLAIDGRPHSHHHQLMKQVRASSTESGVVEVGGAALCGFATRWGDGIYDVFRDLDADGRLVQIRIELDTPERRDIARTVSALACSALVSRMIVEDDEPVRSLFRVEPEHDGDSGWRMYSGVEPEGYDADPDNIVVVPLSMLAKMDRRLLALVGAPVGSAFECGPGAEDFVAVSDGAPSR